MRRAVGKLFVGVLICAHMSTINARATQCTCTYVHSLMHPLLMASGWPAITEINYALLPFPVCSTFWFDRFRYEWTPAESVKHTHANMRTCAYTQWFKNTCSLRKSRTHAIAIDTPVNSNGVISTARISARIQMQLFTSQLRVVPVNCWHKKLQRVCVCACECVKVNRLHGCLALQRPTTE